MYDPRQNRKPQTRGQHFAKAFVIGMAASAAILFLLDLYGVIDVIKGWP